MLSEVFCYRLLTSKNQFVHTFLIDVNIIFLWILWPIDWCNRSGHIAHLILLGIIFRPDMSFYDMSCFLLYSSALHTSLARVQGFPLMITTHNSTALKKNGMTEDIFICSSFWSKNFLSSVIRYKKVHVYAHNCSVFVSSSSDMHQSHQRDGCQAKGTCTNPTKVMDAKQKALTLLLIFPSGPSVLDDPRTT